MTPEWQRYQELQNTRPDCFFVMDMREPERPVWPRRFKLVVIVLFSVFAVVATVAGGW